MPAEQMDGGNISSLWHHVYAITCKHTTQTHAACTRTNTYTLHRKMLMEISSVIKVSTWCTAHIHTHTHTFGVLVFLMKPSVRFFLCWYWAHACVDTDAHPHTNWVIRQTSSCYGENRVPAKRLWHANDALSTQGVQPHTLAPYKFRKSDY